MLTDIFAFRYEDQVLFPGFREADRRLFVQAFRLLDTDLMPYYGYKGQERDGAKAEWASVHDKICRELGVKELSPLSYTYSQTFNGNKIYRTAWHPLSKVCENYVCAPYDPQWDADQFIKRRLSFVEMAFRECEQRAKVQCEAYDRQIAQLAHPGTISPPGGLRIPGNRRDGLESAKREVEKKIRSAVDELNERLRRAGYPLHYHNGFIQISKDEKIKQEIENPFWILVNNPKWANVDHDMKEAVDLRDNCGRDPAWYAAKALESTIKIISNEKGWTHGQEKGAHNYIENLASQRASGFIDKWEADLLKQLFTAIRNPFGHGAGSNQMPKLSNQQTSWAIEFCMSWTKSLIERM